MKKLLISSILFISTLFLLSFSVFAATETTNSRSKTAEVGNAIKNTAEDARNAVGNVENGIENGVMNVKNAVTGVTGDVENTAQNGVNTVMNNADNYTAEKTSANSGIMGMSSTTWTWMILGIVGIVIVGLVWYYGSQYEHTNYNDGE